MGGYLSPSYRDHRYLYIRNYEPVRWPNGSPNWQQAAFKDTWCGDTDNGPTKSDIIDHKDRSPADKRFYDLSFAKRLAEELCDLETDPYQLNNIAGTNPETILEYARLLFRELHDSNDPRDGGPAFDFDEPYIGDGLGFPGGSRK